jgi:hypothetical protein
MYYIFAWLMFGFISWIHAYKHKQFLYEKSFVIMPLFMLGGMISYLCLVFYWILTKRGRKLYHNPFHNR